ncbi:MAG: polysaccharide deacetylase family protein [Candidatus Zixiibacteriota bacterium]
MFGAARILAFHQTSKKYYPGINNIKPGYFFVMLDVLRESGFSFWNGEEGDAVGDTALVLTFDDGYADNVEVLLRLREIHVTPIVFVPTDFIGKINSWEYSTRIFPARHMDKSQIRELREAGVLFGTHGKSHRALPLMKKETLVDELRSSRSIIEDIAGRECTLLSYPFGRHDRRVNLEALEIGYKAGLALDRPCRDSGETDDFVLFRKPVYSIDDYYSLRDKLLIDSGRDRRKNDIINTLAGGTIITGGRIK